MEVIHLTLHYFRKSFEAYKGSVNIPYSLNNCDKKETGRPPWELRIGIHTGAVVAGVVGRKKYAYDVWGSTVNIASRMESNGEPGRVNISAATYQLVKDHYICIYRGKILAKNGGEIDMYFVESEITEEPLPEVGLLQQNAWTDKQGV